MKYMYIFDDAQLVTIKVAVVLRIHECERERVACNVQPETIAHYDLELSELRPVYELLQNGGREIHPH